MEHPKLAAARKYCKEKKLRYYIKNDALFLYDPFIGHYRQSCFNLLNFSTEAEIRKMIDQAVKGIGL